MQICNNVSRRLTYGLLCATFKCLVVRHRSDVRHTPCINLQISMRHICYDSNNILSRTLFKTAKTNNTYRLAHLCQQNIWYQKYAVKRSRNVVPFHSCLYHFQLNVILKADELKRASIQVDVFATFSSTTNKGVFVN